MVEKLNLEDLTKENKKSDLWAKISDKNKLKKPGEILVLYGRENGELEPMVMQPKNGFFNIDGHSYHERKDCVFRITKDKIPVAIIMSWKLYPVGTKGYDDIPEEQRLQEMQYHVVKAISNAELVRMGEGTGKKLNAKWVMIVVVGLIIAFAFLKNYVHLS